MSFHNADSVSMVIALQMKFDAPAENRWTTQQAILGAVYMEVGELSRGRK